MANDKKRVTLKEPVDREADCFNAVGRIPALLNDPVLAAKLKQVIEDKITALLQNAPKSEATRKNTKGPR